jgi:cation diffusion facilitator family transporter
MYRFTACAGARNNSPAILADAFENRADALSSAAVIVGIIAAHVVHPVCDPIAALLVGAIIFWNCQERLREAASGLMDRGLPMERIEAIKQSVLGHSHVASVAFIRTRQTGVRFWIDLGIRVPEGLTVEAADRVASAVRGTVAASPQCHYVEVYLFPAAAAINGTTVESIQE